MKKIFFTSFLFLSFFTFTFSASYQPLAPIEGYVSKDSTFGNGEKGLVPYLKSMYSLGVGIATALAVLMIIWGGIEYMTTDAIGGKEGGKEKVQNAMMGLLLALGSYVILRTINKDFVIFQLNLTPVNLSGVKPTVVPIIKFGIDNDLTPDFTDENITYNPDGSIANTAGVSANGKSLLMNALDAANPAGGMSTSGIAGTEGGNKACAYAVSTLLQKSGYDMPTVLGTPELYDRLKSSSQFQEVQGIGNALPGDIIISPSQPNVVGHVGVCSGPGCSSIISNSSKAKRVLQNFSGSRWVNYYGNQKGLPVIVFRPK